jgi:hypothetical protein
LGSVVSQAASEPSGDYWRGEPVTLSKIGRLAVPRGARVFRLGEGGEATVYRVERLSGESEVYRLEKEKPDMPIAFFHRNMDFLAEALSDPETGDPLPGDKSFKVVRCEKTRDPKVRKVEDVRGTSLEALIERVGPESDEGRKLIALFEARSAELVLRAKDVVGRAQGQRMQTASTNRNILYAYQSITTGQPIAGIADAYVGAAIVWRNVIVDPRTYEMTIIDPY